MFKELLMLLYGAPTLVVDHRRHSHYRSIYKLDLYVGWTVTGWLVALAWALWRSRRRDPSRRGGQVACVTCSKKCQPKYRGTAVEAA